MKIFFILGRNPELSKEEVLSYLEARKIRFEEIVFSENILILDILKGSKKSFVEPKVSEFGGVMKIGKVLFEGEGSKFEEYLKDQDIIPSDKFSYSVTGNLDPEPLKQKFKREKRKAVLKHGRTRLKLQDGTKISLPKANFHLFLQESKEKIYFGKLTQIFDSKPPAFRDMNKPIRREHLAISPRLAKILINLSGAKKGDLLLDPFSGVGGILQEALLKEISCHGVDLDPGAIKACKKNLIWLYKKYKIRESYHLESKDSRSIENLRFSAIATETPLGTVLKRKPRDSEAKEIIEKFERLITPILKHLKNCKKPTSKIAITFPRIKDTSVDLKRIAEKTNLKVIKGPILEAREDQFISREIIVLQ